MNKKHFYLALVFGLSAIGVWGGRLLWRAHKDIVSLQVRNAPLAEVIRSIEWQTWEKVVADAQLNTQITLNVDDMPLREVLERIAEQAGAILTTVHAVHDARSALQQLELALEAGEITKAKGWTNIAPSLDAPADTLGGPPSDMPPGKIMGGDHLAEAPRELSVSADKPRSMPFAGGAGPMVMRQGIPGGPMEVIIPERIVLDTKLQNGLKTNVFSLPDITTALAVAEQVDGNCTTLYALKKSAIGFPPGGLRQHRMGPPPAGATNAPGPMPLANAAQNARRAELGRYMNLTPEQRVEQSRNRRPRLMKPPEGEPPQ